MEEKLLEYLKIKKTSVSIEEICADFKITSEKEKDFLTYSLKELEKSAKIFVDSNHKYIIFPKDTEIIQGRIKKDSKGNYFLNANKSIVIHPNYLNGALEDDIVLVVKQGLIGKVKKIISRSEKNLIFECLVKNNQKRMIPIGFNIKEEITFNQKELANLVDGSVVLVSISTEKNGDTFEGKVIKEIGHKDDPNLKVKKIASAHNVEIDFSKAALQELDDIPNSVEESETTNRLDLRDQMIFTIDSEHTKDIDDAISLEINDKGNYVLGVHIADVAHYIKPNSQLFAEACERANSVYALDYVIPMLPHKISNGICSLNENEDRLTKSCIMEIDPTGNIVDYKICDSIINSNKKMTYESVNEILENNNIPEGYEKYTDTLIKMQRLSLILEQKRIAQGKVDFAENELETTQNERGEIINITQIKRASGEKLIENFMVLANETVASNYCYLPFVYRVHDMPRKEILENVFEYIRTLNLGIKIPKTANNAKAIQNILLRLKKCPSYPIISDLILKGMARAEYSTNNIGHFALASPTYTHFTSPIRRINDLVAHSLINLYNTNFDVNAMDDLESDLKGICINASKKERVADEIEREAMQEAITEFLENNIGHMFQATILCINARYITVKLENGIIGNVGIKNLGNHGFSYRASSNTLKCNNDVLIPGSEIAVTVLEKIPGDNKIRFGYTKNKVKTL